jgi:hypothetical protein
MERPQDFPKALNVLAGISAFLFIVPPAIGYHYLGNYSTAPAFGSLGTDVYKKASFAFVIVPTLVIGVIYANVSAKFVYGRIMGKSRHAHSNTVVGWGVWIVVMAAIWFVGFVFAEVIPSMGVSATLAGNLQRSTDICLGFPQSSRCRLRLLLWLHLLCCSILANAQGKPVRWHMAKRQDSHPCLCHVLRSFPPRARALCRCGGYNRGLQRSCQASFLLRQRVYLRVDELCG